MSKEKFERMIQRFHDQAFQRMSPERRARKISLMKSLVRSSIRIKNKENEDPFNNNTKALPRSFSNSTPIKSAQITDLDDETEFERKTIRIHLNEETEYEEAEINEASKPQLVIAKLYDLNSNGESSFAQTKEGHCEEEEEEEQEEEFEIDFSPLEIDDGDDKSSSMVNDDSHWRSLDVMDDTAEEEFFKSLEESKLSVSTSSLLEEIQADLPISYSLTKPLDHTFHSLISYRTMTRLTRMDSNVTCPEVVEQRDSMRSYSLTSKRDFLEMEMKIQNCLAKQAQKAMIVSKTQKLIGVEHLECEKALLLANLRFSAAEQEYKKMNIIGEISDREDYGQVTISDLFFTVESNENSQGLYICTATEKENVQASSMVSEIVDGQLHFKEPFVFQNLRKNFVVYIELFRLNSVKEKGKPKSFLLKKLMKMTPVNAARSLPESFSGFIHMGCADLRLRDITNRENDKCLIYFSETSIQPIFGPSVNLFLKTDLNIKFKLKGFLSIFKSTWHRRWYVQSGYFLKSWMYPEDTESGKEPIDSFFLPHDIAEVKAGGLEVCARPNSFIITLKQGNVDILFFADTTKEMNRWIDHLNLILGHIEVWKPNV